MTIIGIISLGVKFIPCKQMFSHKYSKTRPMVLISLYICTFQRTCSVLMLVCNSVEIKGKRTI